MAPHETDCYGSAEWDNLFPIDDTEENPVITKSRYYELDDLNNLMKTIDADTNLSVLNINARSLVKHYREFTAILADLPFLFDVITTSTSTSTSLRGGPGHSQPCYGINHGRFPRFLQGRV